MPSNDLRPSARKRGYDSKWEKARAYYLKHHPLCVMCRSAGRTEEARVVDHIVPHRGNKELFWDSDNWQSLCKPCHDGAKQSMEKGAALERGCNADGLPLDGRHHWNKG